MKTSNAMRDMDPVARKSLTIPEFMRADNPDRVARTKAYWADPANKMAAKRVSPHKSRSKPLVSKRQRRGVDKDVLMKNGFPRSAIMNMTADDVTYHAMRKTTWEDFNAPPPLAGTKIKIVGRGKIAKGVTIRRKA